jgi:hypothetical protein
MISGFVLDWSVILAATPKSICQSKKSGVSGPVLARTEFAHSLAEV